MKILIVEDSVFVQNMTKKVVRDHFPDYEIATANNGAAGFDLYQEFQPDILLTDLLMPEISGQELIRKIRERDSRLKIIVPRRTFSMRPETKWKRWALSGS